MHFFLWRDHSLGYFIHNQPSQPSIALLEKIKQISDVFQKFPRNLCYQILTRSQGMFKFHFIYVKTCPQLSMEPCVSDCSQAKQDFRSQRGKRRNGLTCRAQRAFHPDLLSVKSIYTQLHQNRQIHRDSRLLRAGRWGKWRMSGNKTGLLFGVREMF